LTDLEVNGLTDATCGGVEFRTFAHKWFDTEEIYRTIFIWVAEVRVNFDIKLGLKSIFVDSEEDIDWSQVYETGAFRLYDDECGYGWYFTLSRELWKSVAFCAWLKS
jgi:hypothetical protein